MLRQAIAMSLEQEWAQEDEEELLKMALAMSLEEEDIKGSAGIMGAKS